MSSQVTRGLLLKTQTLKTADQSLNSSTTLTNDNDLLQAIAANEVWRFRFFVPFNLAGVASGFKFGVNGPTAPTNLRYSMKVVNGVGGTLVTAASKSAFASALAAALATSGDHFAEIEGAMENGANAGTLQLQFAQNTSDAGAITVQRGAFLIAERLS